MDLVKTKRQFLVETHVCPFKLKLAYNVFFFIFNDDLFFHSSLDFIPQGYEAPRKEPQQLWQSWRWWRLSNRTWNVWFLMMCWFNWDHFSQCLVYSKSLSKPCTTWLRYYEFPPVVYFIFPAFVYNDILLYSHPLYISYSQRLYI